MPNGYRNALMFFGPGGLVEFITQVVSDWQMGGDFVLVFCKDETHDTQSCACPRLVFTRDAQNLVHLDQQQGGPAV